MNLYFSGLNSASEAPMLAAAGVSHLLVDWKDINKLPPGFSGRLALDSGAYRAHKKGESITLPEYDSIIQSMHPRLDWAAARDVFADPFATYRRQRADLTSSTVPKIPVWQWGGPDLHLHYWLSRSEIIAIGGLVPLMRDKNESVLKQLLHLCRQYPGRFHLFGLNWLKAINELRGIARSCDTSKWLDGGRYGHLIFVHEKTGKLHQAPAKALGCGHYDRPTRCIESARAMESYLNTV